MSDITLAVKALETAMVRAMKATDDEGRMVRLLPSAGGLPLGASSATVAQFERQIAWMHSHVPEGDTSKARNIRLLERCRDAARKLAVLQGRA